MLAQVLLTTWKKPLAMYRPVILLVIVIFSGVVYGQGWSHIRGGLTGISGSLSYIWGVYGSKIYMCQRPCTGAWKLINGGLVQVDVDDTEVWGVAGDNTIWKRPIDASANWQRVPGLLTHVSASGYGYVWGVNKQQMIYKCKKPCSGKWVQVRGRLKQIDGGQRAIYGVNHVNDIWTIAVDGSGTWRRVPGPPGKAKYITASGVDDIFAINDKDQIFRCEKPCVGEWIQLGSNARLHQCDATVDGLFGVNSARHVWKKSFPLQ